MTPDQARAVKVVKQLKNDEYPVAWNSALSAVIDALQRGRTQKGTR